MTDDSAMTGNRTLYLQHIKNILISLETTIECKLIQLFKSIRKEVYDNGNEKISMGYRPESDYRRGFGSSWSVGCQCYDPVEFFNRLNH